MQQRSKLAATRSLPRRHFLAAGGALALTQLPGCGGGAADTSAEADAEALHSRQRGDGASGTTTTSTSGLATPPANPKARVIVVGGGMGGVTAAKYLRMWGDQVDVTLVDRSATYTSNIMSSLVLTGQRTLSSLQYGYGALASKYGVRTVLGPTAEVAGIDVPNARVTLADGRVLAGDRLVLAPGIDFDLAPLQALGLTNPSAMPHAWTAGAQTTLLAQQLKAMSNAGVFILSVPPVPYRCPPGPYERACLVADWIKRNKPQGKVIVLDANADFTVERENFTAAFAMHGISHVKGVVITGIDQASKTLFTNQGSFRGDVVNLIPAQKAPPMIFAAGLANAQGNRFAGVNMLSYASTVAGAGRVHVIGDASATSQPKAGHVANQEAKVLADALSRIFAGGAPDPQPVTTSACYSTITMSQASWLHALYQYDAGQAKMVLANNATAPDASVRWSSDAFEEMGKWFGALMADTFA